MCICTHACTHICIHSHTHGHTPMLHTSHTYTPHTCTHIHPCAHPHTCTCTEHVHMPLCTPVHTQHVHTHTHTHPWALTCCVWFPTDPAFPHQAFPGPTGVGVLIPGFPTLKDRVVKTSHRPTPFLMGQVPLRDRTHYPAALRSVVRGRPPEGTSAF